MLTFLENREFIALNVATRNTMFEQLVTGVSMELNGRMKSILNK